MVATAFFLAVANTIKEARATQPHASVVRDHYKSIIKQIPRQVEICTEKKVGGDKTGDAVVGAIIGGIIGNNVTIKCGVYLWDAMRIEDNVFIGPNATFSNDKFPKSKQKPPVFLPIVLKRGCSIGANATILPNVTIGENAMIGAGAIVTKDVPSQSVVTNTNEIKFI